jgi:3-oxoacyl-[acyl-carrier protein] reductase
MAELPLQSLAGRIAVVTGASGGIGAASARLLAQAGATVIVGYNSRKDRADALIAELPGRGHLAQQIVLEDVEGNRRLAALLGERFGRVDVLVNSAGFTRPVAHADLETMD